MSCMIAKGLQRALLMSLMSLGLVLPGSNLQAFERKQDVAEVARAAIATGVAASGEFEFVVKNTGQDRKFLYLNSEADYRSPASLTIAVPRGQWQQVIALVGDDASEFVGKTVRVSGKVARKKIYLPSNERRSTRKYYYQAHLGLKHADNISLVR